MEKGSSSSSSSPAAAAAGPDALNGFKFGKKIYFEEGAAGRCSGLGLHPKTGPPPPPPPSPAKKGRTATGLVQAGQQPPRCQVEGCMLDLSDAKAYYSRHKVCGMHSKSAKVIVAGLEQRFCQQCSRFHQLPEFDQGKRSCRRRLAGHNERRRKPPPGSVLPPYYGSLCPPLFDNHAKRGGGFMMDFSAYPTSLTGRDSWPNGQGLENQTAKPQLLTWLQSNNAQNQNPPFGNIHQHQQEGSGPPLVPSEGCFNSGVSVSDSTSALSLLSNHQPWVARRSRPSSVGVGVNDFLSSGSTSLAAEPAVNLPNPAPAPAPAPATVQFAYYPSWGFFASKGNQTGNSLPPEMGLPQFSHPTIPPTNDDEYAAGEEELGLAQPSDSDLHDDRSRSGGYDASIQHMHWSL